MNIVLISTYDTTCGIATYSHNLAKELAKEHNVLVLAELESRELKPKSGKIELENNRFINWVKCWKRFQPYETQLGLSAIPVILKTLDTKPDVIHIQHEFGIFPHDASFFRLFENLPYQNTVITLHTISQPPNNIGFFTRLNQKIIKIIAHSPEGLASVDFDQSNNMGSFSPRVVIPHGCPINYGQNLKELPKDVNILCPGFISPSKGHEELIESFALAFDQLDRKTNLHFVGLCRDSAYLTRLEEQIKSYNLENSIYIDEGFKTEREIIEYLSSVDFVLLGGGKTSPYSASGQLAQAVGSYLPVIVKDIPIYRSQYSDKILRFSDKYQCARLIKQLVNNENLREKLGDHNNFISWEQAAKRHVDLYKIVD